MTNICKTKTKNANFTQKMPLNTGRDMQDRVKNALQLREKVRPSTSTSPFQRD